MRMFIYSQEYSSVTFWNHFLKYLSSRNSGISSSRTQSTITQGKHLSVNTSFISTGTVLYQNGQRIQTSQRLQLVHKLHREMYLMIKLKLLGDVCKTLQKQKKLDYLSLMSIMANSPLNHCKTLTWTSYASFYTANLKFRPYVKVLSEYLKLTLYIIPETDRKMRHTSIDCLWF